MDKQDSSIDLFIVSIFAILIIQFLKYISLLTTFLGNALCLDCYV
jgi:hypothetical protein